MGAGDTGGWNGQRSINCYSAACLQRHRSKPQDKNLMLWHLQTTVGISDDFHRACQKDAFKSHLNAGNTLSTSASPPKRPQRPPLHTLVGAGPEPASGTMAPACQLLGPATHWAHQAGSEDSQKAEPSRSTEEHPSVSHRSPSLITLQMLLASPLPARQVPRRFLPSQHLTGEQA